MFEIIGLIAAVGAAGTGYVKTKDFVRRRMRFHEGVRRSSAPLIAGAAATAVAAPVVWVLPIIGAGTALAFGAAVGLGTHAGARSVERGDVWED